jgi:hypothetical protein
MRSVQRSLPISADAALGSPSAPVLVASSNRKTSPVVARLNQEELAVLKSALGTRSPSTVSSVESGMGTI